MTIDKDSLPSDAIVQLEEVWWGPVNDLDETDENVTAVYVPVPDGVAYDDALRAVNERPWVPAASWVDIPSGARWRCNGVKGVDDHEAFFIHPDDVPDPDADLIERIAKAIHEAEFSAAWEHLHEDTREAYRRQSRRVLAVIREDQP